MGVWQIPCERSSIRHEVLAFTVALWKSRPAATSVCSLELFLKPRRGVIVRMTKLTRCGTGRAQQAPELRLLWARIGRAVNLMRLRTIIARG